MEAIEKIEYKGMEISIYNDDSEDSPRDWDNMGKMICFHSSYILGDKHTYNSDNYNDLNELKEAIKKEENAVIMLPLGLYDHSGITMYIGNIHNRWDGSQVGWIIAKRDDILKEYNVKRISKQLLARVETQLRQEVKTYDQYLTGQVYGYSSDAGSCWGFYNYDDMIKEAKDEIDLYLLNKEKAKEKKLKAQIIHNVPLQYRTA